ncbi:pyridine nucleotide-disulfide oxidoreductase [Brachybacterium ginsengisoli]|uniref:Pyridine nucleotide-disulfide oxidoreductase n=1 Tax=Brachybacterium ginsengisoli TaxID=1331682 RepID=A0A291GUQ5_9MICO|nr:NAD(P)/FAD-dependent oxidoreductase [Brachybacterium ginsengisoli]ATG53824.1 pyridine nucleotide-disulfide oxidoreductase [Brachybacterium ginsengisoli]
MAHETTTPAEITVDVIVIGGGPVGENVAQYAIEGTDLTAAIVEGELLGGECSYYACMPSKALLRPLAVADAAAHLPGLVAPSLDRDALLARRDTWVSHYDDAGQVSWAEGAGLQVVRGHGRIVGEREVLVEAADESAGAGPTRILARRAVVIATGSEAVVPGPLRDLAPWTSRDATGVQEVPGELVIIGGGVVAVEAATWMAALGTKVTLLVRGDSLLSGLEPFAGEHVLEALRDRGVTVELGTSVVSGSREEARATGLGRVHGGRVTLQVEDSRGRREISADEVLAATGRRPALGDLGLETIGLSAEDVLAAGAPSDAAADAAAGDATGSPLPGWLHAVGDASGEAPLTHWGKYRARVIGQAIRAGATGEALEPVPEQVPVPQVVFTDPQATSVGLTEEQAREEGHDVVTARVPFAGAAGSALLRDDVTGTAQLVVDRSTTMLVGATFVGPDASELIHAATIAIVGQVPVHVLRHAVPSYPTVSELWLRLLEELPVELRRG